MIISGRLLKILVEQAILGQKVTAARAGYESLLDGFPAGLSLFSGFDRFFGFLGYFFIHVNRILVSAAYLSNEWPFCTHNAKLRPAKCQLAMGYLQPGLVFRIIPNPVRYSHEETISHGNPFRHFIRRTNL